MVPRPSSKQTGAPGGGAAGGDVTHVHLVAAERTGPRWRSLLQEFPPLTVIDGDVVLGQDEADEQERRACSDIADGIARALTRLSPCHPHRSEYLAMLADFRGAAGPLASRSLVLAG